MERAKTIISKDRFDFLEQYYSLMNLFFPEDKRMTGTEAKVLACFMSVEGELAEIDRFGSSSRKLVTKKLGLTASGISNYTRSLRDKGIMELDKNGDFTVPAIFNAPYVETTVIIKLVPHDQAT